MVNHNATDFYVYVYIDPRNFKEFYCGKGRGSRKYAHLNEVSESDKCRILNEITEQGQSPIIKVIAAGLTEHEALLVEKTLIWKMQDSLTNLATGHFAGKFRPLNTMHKNLPGFDFENQIHYVNIGEDEHRNWDDSRRYGFIAAGQGTNWKNQLDRLNPGDIVVAYLKKHGYVGVGKVMELPVPIDKFLYNGKPLTTEMLVAPKPFENHDDKDLSEYLVRIEWLRSVARDVAKWKKSANLYTSQLVVASLVNQPQTIEYIERQFKIGIYEVAENSHADFTSYKQKAS